MAVSSMTFDESYYLTQNPDVLTAILNGFFANAEQHFNLHGYKELRDPNSAFDTSYYLSANPDVLSAGVNPFNHFIANGASENRAPTEALATAGTTFDSATYLSTYPDVQTAITAGSFTSAYQHWVLFGQFETRTAQTTDGTALTGSGSSSSTGSTFTLTTGVDSPTGTANADTFVGVIETNIAAGATFNSGDNLNGGAGIDTLNLTVGTNAAPVTTLTAVERVIFTPGVDLTAISAANWTGVTEVGVKNPTADANVTVTNLQNNVELSAENVTGFTTNDAIINASFQSGKIGSAAATLSLDVSSVGATGFVPEFNITTAGTDKFTTIAVAATGSNVVNVDATGANMVAPTSLTFSGAGTVTLAPGDSGNVVFSSVATVDASANTGGATVNVAASTKDLTATGGSGKDSFTVDLATSGTVKVDAGAGNDTVTIDGTGANLTAANLNSTDSVIGGDGTDTLVMRSGTATALAADTDRTVITGFETIRLSTDFGANNAALDVSKFGSINSVEIGATNTTNTVAMTGFTSGASVGYRAAGDSTTAINIGMTNATSAGTPSDALTIGLNSDLAAGDGNQFALGVDGINLLTVTTADRDNTNNATSATDGTGYGLTLSNDTAVTKVTGTGDRSLSYTASTTATSIGEIDLSAMTGRNVVNLGSPTFTQGVAVSIGAGGGYVGGTNSADALTGGAKADVLLGNAGNDVIVGGGGADFLHGGTGKDTMTGGEGADNFGVSAITDNTSAATLTFDTITDIDLSNETISVGLSVTSIQNVSGTVAGADLKAAATTALATIGASGSGTALKAGTFEYDGNTYLLVNGNDLTLDNSDYLVKITGSSGTLATTSFTTNGVTITGTASNDVFFATDLADTIVAGTGDDFILAGGGADTMTGGTGTNTFRFTAAADVTANTPDTITDFDASTTNILSFNGAASPGFGLVGTNTISHFEGAQGTFAETNNVVVVTTAVVGALTSANAATAIGSATGNYAIADGVIFVVSNNTDSAVFKFTSAAADATVTAGELGAGPIITLTGVDTAELTATGAANFSLFA